ncbi:urease accessory protein UreD [Telmatospirillum sp. J64-1]|uniref:urease accessory protein UreD n=1 Tax=Telmatospirillum sp. J64-1 TaxID=2502183 RepID=UPI00115E03A1|nr:urease accessory protein UreD [Telmatospirillum sp. J64-1]
MAALQGRVELGYKLSEDGASRLSHLYHSNPLRVLFPAPAPGEPPQAVLVTTSGGLVGGDRLDISIQAGEGAQAQVVASAAEKVYRSTGADCLLSLDLEARDGAWLEYLPQETILFEGARLRRITRVQRAASARVLAGEMIVLGRTARGETVTHGLLRDAWEVRVDGRLVWADALHLDGDIAAAIAQPAGFGGAIACATILYSAEDAAQWLEPARELLEGCAVRAGASCVNGQLVIRFLSPDALALRKDYGRVWTGLRARIADLPERLPRIWEI